MSDAPRRRSAFAAPPAQEQPQPEEPETGAEVEKKAPGVVFKMEGQDEAFNPFDKGSWTEERRQKQRERIHKLIDEGRFGGQNGFGRKRSKKVQEIVAEHAQEQAELIKTRLDGMLNQQRDKRLQLEAIRELFKAEQWATENLRDEERFYREMNEEELDIQLRSMIGDALGLDLSDFDLELSDADVVEFEREITDGSCARCEDERSELERLLREAGVDDEDGIQQQVAQTFCVRHRFERAQEAADASA